MKIGLLARIRSPRDCPSFRGSPPTRMTQSAPSNASSALSVALTSARSGKAQSSSSIMRAVQRGQRRGDLEQLEGHRPIGAEGGPRGDAEQQGIADLAPRSRDSDANWRGHALGSVEEGGMGSPNSQWNWPAAETGSDGECNRHFAGWPRAAWVCGPHDGGMRMPGSGTGIAGALTWAVLAIGRLGRFDSVIDTVTFT